MRETSPVVQWRFQTKGRLGRCSPALTAEGTIYLGDHDCQLYALSATGELLWRRRTAGRLGDATPAVTANGDLLLASETGRLYCFSAAGDLRWSSTRNWLAVTSAALTADGRAIFSARRQNQAVGENYRLMAVDEAGNEVWERAIQGDAGDTPVISADGTIYVGTHKGYLHAITSDGTIKWQCRLGGRISSAAALTPAGLLLMGTQDGCLYAITPEMECAWKYATRDMINHCAPAIAPDGTIYLGSWDHCLYALTPEGRLKWKFVTGRPIAASPAIAADGTIYFGSQDTHLYALYPDGQKKWELQTDSPFAASPVITAEGTVVICTQNRTVLALAEQNGGVAHEGWPLLAGNPQRSSRQALSGRHMASPRLALADSRLRQVGRGLGWCCSSPLSTPAPASGVDFSWGHRVRPAEIRRTRCLFSAATG